MIDDHERFLIFLSFPVFSWSILIVPGTVRIDQERSKRIVVNVRSSTSFLRWPGLIYDIPGSTVRKNILLPFCVRLCYETSSSGKAFLPMSLFWPWNIYVPLRTFTTILFDRSWSFLEQSGSIRNDQKE